jgi:hypothetical protein
MPMGFWRTRSHRLRARRSDSPRAPSAPRPWLLVGVAALAAGAALIGAPGCKRGSSPPAPAAPVPSLRIYALGGAAGAIEPCGCVKDMLGGVDHAAAFLSQQRKSGVGSLLVGAGPMLFADPTIPPAQRTQALFKADTMARSLKDLGLVAWAPGANDWALGEAELARLRTESGAALLAGNLSGATAGARAAQVVEVGGHKVGLVGVSLPDVRGAGVEGIQVQSAEEALRAGHAQVTAEGADLVVALVAAHRGTALRLAESARGYQLVVVGKGYDQGEANDPPFPPSVIGDALVVQAPNHLQGVGVVDLYVRDGSYRFADGSGLALEEERSSLDRRIEELEARLSEWQRNGASSEEIEARRKDLAELRARRARLAEPSQPTAGSYFRYELVQVRESLGADAQVAKRLEAYYKRVNEHNREAFADAKPPPVPEGQSGYVGVEQCSTCHEAARKFWDGTPHAQAYVTLEREHKQFNLDCVSCHVTGYDKPGGSTVTHVEGLEAVQCENCHGPGSRHVANPTDKTLIRRVPDQGMCASACHHPPHVADDWQVSDAWPKILGPGHGR